MVTSKHEASHRIFQERPELLKPVFEILGVPLPDDLTVVELSPDVTEIYPLERRVDSVLRIAGADGSGLVLAIEAQGRRSDEKEVSWAYYLAYLKSKYKLPALLLVCCTDRTTAQWARGPFLLGSPGWTSLSVHPLAVGPDNLPFSPRSTALPEIWRLPRFPPSHTPMDATAKPYWRRLRRHWLPRTPTRPNTSGNSWTSV